MLTTSWNDAEDIALRRLPWRARIVYLQGIRRYMDYQTGWAGKRRILSYQFFLELLECADHTTSPDPVVTKRGLQTIFLMLERVGLVAWPRGDAAQRGVVFHCLLADTDDSVQKQAVPKRYPSGTQEAVPGNASEYSEIDGVAVPIFVAARQGEAVPPPVSGIREDLRVAKATVDPASGGPDLPQVSPSTTNRPKKNSAPSGASLPVRAVFQYWQQVMNHPDAILDNKRSKAIAARIKEGHSVDKLKQAIDGCKASPWHQGKNNRQTVYDDIELICRDAKHVEEFITRVSGKSTQQQELDAWINHDNFIEGECRHVQA